MSTTDDDECIHGLGPVTACVICNGRDKRETAERWKIGHVIHAKFDSDCPRCNQPIHEGATIGSTTSDGYIHIACGSLS